ncbi:MAG: MerR family transcriptional regulator [Microvirga sp.]
MEKAPDAFRIISEVASDLDVPQHVLRFWESRFSQIRPMKRGGGRRYYRPDDIDLLRGIRHLLYSEGYTIRGVQRLLREQGIGFVQTVWQDNVAVPAPNGADADGDAGSHPRDRLLLNLLPGFRKSREFLSGAPDTVPNDNETSDDAFDDENDAVNGEEDSPPISAPMPRMSSHAAGHLAPEQVERLQAALDELGECRRLIDEALAQAGNDR